MTEAATVDRQARNRLINAIELYTRDEITNNAFDDAIWAVGHETNDELAKDTVRSLWHMYDDVRTHHIEASKEEWDFMQRLKLLLQSDLMTMPEGRSTSTTLDRALLPFQSVSELLAVRRSVTNFQKLSYRRELENRRKQNLKRYSRKTTALTAGVILVVWLVYLLLF